MTTKPDHSDDEYWAALVPELMVRDLNRSLAFYRDGCGFNLRYARPEDGFAYLQLGRAQMMLEEVHAESWQTGPLELPFGRGINLQIEVTDATALCTRLTRLGVPIYRPLSTDWYRDGDAEHGQTQFLVQDPDGYLLRFMQPLDTRPLDRDGSG